MISEFDKVRIESIEEEANPGHYVTVDDTGKLYKFAVPLKTIADAWPIGGLNVRGYATNAPILGIYYTAPPETVTMQAAPTTANWLRRDTVAVNTLNRIVILPGTPGLVGAAPVVDLNLYFPIRDLVLLANATEPVDPVTLTGNSNEFVLFAETGTVAGGEANVSGSAATIAVTANTQIAGAKSIEATNVQKLHEARFEFLELKSTVGKTHFIYKLKLKAAVQTSKYWFFRLYNGTTTLGNFLFKHGQYGFDANQLGVQYLSIPIDATPFVNVSYTKATLFFYHGATTIPGYYIDDVKFLNSLPTIVYADQVQSDWNETDQNKVSYIKGRFDQTLKEDKTNKGIANGYAPLNSSIKIASTYLDIVNDLINGSATNLLSGNQGVVLKSQIDAIYILLASDNINLDTVQEIVDAIETVQLSLNTILVNDLVTGGVTKALTAEQGKVLKGLYDDLLLVVNEKVDKVAGKGLSTNDYTTLEKQTLAKFNVPLTQDLIPVSQLDGSIIWQTAPAGGAGALGIVTVATSPYTFLLTDVAQKVIFTSATAVSATIPTNAVTAIPIGSKIEVTQSGVGIVTLVTTGLTVITANYLTLVQGQTVYLTKTAINTWSIDSNLEASGDQTVSGLKTFLQDKIGFRNTANTFTSFIRNANTAIRAYTLPNKDGTFAMTSDIIAQMNGVVNYLVKFGTTTTGVVSRIWDTGVSLGIGVINTPTKDITLGNQNNKEIGVELSNSSTVGRSLTISAGKTIDYQLNTEFIALGQIFRNWIEIAGALNGDIYATASTVGILKQTGGVGIFVDMGQPTFVSGITVSASGNVYAIKSGDIYMQTGGVGNFVALGQTIRSWQSLTSTPNGNVYATVTSADIYMQTNGVGNFVALNQVSRSYKRIVSAINGNNDVYALSGYILYKQTAGIGDFLQVTVNVSGDFYGIGVANNGNVYISSNVTYIYVQVGGVGNFVAVQFGAFSWRGMCCAINGNMYVTALANDIFMQNNNTIGAPNLDGGTLINKAGTGKGTGKSRYQIVTGQKTVSGTNMQIETVRAEFDESGNYTRFSTPTFADNASAIAGGLTVGMEYKTATGVKMEVY